MENKPSEEKPNYTFWRVLVVGIILVLLVFLSVGIVRIVPKALNSLANASLSIGSLLDTQSESGAEKSGTETDAANDSKDAAGKDTNSDGKGGFSIRDLTNQSNTGSKNYVPGNDALPSQNKTISGNTSGIGGSDAAGNTNTQTNTSNTRSSGTPSQNESSIQYRSTARTVGASDIAVEITSKGIITNGVFVPTNTFTTNDVAVIKFKIENRGQFATGNWSARVDMPSYNNADKTRTLTNIGSIPAGAAITGEARFDNPISGNTSATITVDTGSVTQDTNRGNNTATAIFAVSGTNTGNGNGTNWTNGSQADLQVRILSTGTVNQFGQYIANTTPRFNSGEKAAIRFEVTNIGGTYTPTWNWRADISGAMTNTYYAPAENGLAPGASARLIVGFDALNGNYGYNYGYGYNQQAQFSVSVDSGNVVYESNEGNNTASVSMTVGY